MSKLPEFSNPEQAHAWLSEKLTAEGEEYFDNERFAFVDDARGMDVYEKRQSEGCCCCGFADEDVIVAGKHARVGLNYGH